MYNKRKYIPSKCTTLMYQFYIAATYFGYPTVVINKLQKRSIKRKLFTYKLHLVINISSGRNLGLTNVITYKITYVCYCKGALINIKFYGIN